MAYELSGEFFPAIIAAFVGDYLGCTGPLLS